MLWPRDTAVRVHPVTPVQTVILLDVQQIRVQMARVL